MIVRVINTSSLAADANLPGWIVAVDSIPKSVEFWFDQFQIRAIPISYRCHFNSLEARVLILSPTTWALALLALQLILGHRKDCVIE